MAAHAWQLAQAVRRRRRARETTRHTKSAANIAITGSIGMRIRSDHIRLGFVQLFEIGNHASEGIVCRLRFEITNVLTQKNSSASRQRNRIL